MEGNIQLQTPQSPRSCGSAAAAGSVCWSLDMRVTALLLTLAGAVILLLLYRLLQLRHRLKVASARHALQYHGFYRTATYTLKHPAPTQDLPIKNGTVHDSSLPGQTVTTVTPFPPPPKPSPPPPPKPSPPPPPKPSPPPPPRPSPPPPPKPSPPPPPKPSPPPPPRPSPPPPPKPSPPPPPKPSPPPPLLPTPPLRPPPALPEAPPILPLPLPLPVIHTTPPSPHLSWGACSDVDVYTRIGTFRTSRLSSLSNQSKVILFEHSSF